MPPLRLIPPDSMHRLFLAGLLLTLGSCVASGVHAVQTFSGSVSHVSDGDTLWVRPNGGEPARKLRIEGIDAPEICQAGGEASREALARRAMNRHVVVTVSRQDDYGRGLARIHVGGKDLGAQMVRDGQAWSYRWRRNPGPYAHEEAAARQAGRGLFEAVAPERPGDFRKRHGTCHVPAR